MPSNNEPTKTSAPPSPTSSEAAEDWTLTKEQKDRVLETLKQIMPSVKAKPGPKPKKKYPKNVN